MEYLKNEFVQQHNTNESVNKKYYNLLNEMNYIHKENDYLKNQLNESQKIKKN